VTALVHRMMHIATTRGGDLELGLVAMERSLITALVLALDDPDPVLDELMDRRATRQAMFLMTVDFALNHMNKDLYVTDLCGVTGIAERTLRQVFQEFTNMSPIAFLNLVRLRRARQLLLNGDPEQMSVKYAALDSGFWDLGRFSVRYRSLFGESPSRTLASAVASAGGTCSCPAGYVMDAAKACVELDESALLGSDLFNPLIQSTCGLLNALDGLDSSFEVTSPLAQLHVKLSHG